MNTILAKLLTSRTIIVALIGVIVSALAKYGVTIDKDAAASLATQIIDSKEQWIALASLVGAIWFRIRAFDFQKPQLASKTFWCGVIAAVASILSLFGVDLPQVELMDLVDQLFVLVPPILVALSGLGVAFFRKKAVTPILPASTPKF